MTKLYIVLTLQQTIKDYLSTLQRKAAFYVFLFIFLLILHFITIYTLYILY